MVCLLVELAFGGLCKVPDLLMKWKGSLGPALHLLEAFHISDVFIRDLFFKGGAALWNLAHYLWKPTSDFCCVSQGIEGAWSISGGPE